MAGFSRASVAGCGSGRCLCSPRLASVPCMRVHWLAGGPKWPLWGGPGCPPQDRSSSSRLAQVHSQGEGEAAGQRAEAARSPEVQAQSWQSVSSTTFCWPGQLWKPVWSTSYLSPYGTELGTGEELSINVCGMDAQVGVMVGCSRTVAGPELITRG